MYPAPLAATAAALRGGQIDLLAYLDDVCDRLAELDPVVQAFLPEADRRARLRTEATALRARFPDPATRPPLYSIPVGVKDVFPVDGFPTQAGSHLPPEVFVALEAACVTMLRAAGALILGKTVTTEFAYFEPGPTRNPHHLDPRAGLILCSDSLDHVGYFTQDVAGTALVASLLCRDWHPVTPAALPTLGVPDGPYLAQASTEALDAFERQLALLQNAGYTVRRVAALDDIEAIHHRHLRLVFAEMAQVHAAWFEQYASLYRPRTAAAIREGRTISAEEAARAREGRMLLRTALESLMAQEGIDVWVCPAAPGPAPEGIDATGSPVMNLPWTYAGMPVITVPAGRSVNGLPLGFQCVAATLADEYLLAWAGPIAGMMARYGSSPFIPRRLTLDETSDLFNSPLHIISVGADLFADALVTQGVPVTRVTWQPAAGNSDAVLSVLLGDPRVNHANQEAVQRMMAARPRFVDVRPAGEAIPGMHKRLLLHAGPPITWERMSGPLRGAITGALLYEGLAADIAAAERLAASGDIAFAPCHHYKAVGPMAGLISASMPVLVIEEPIYGHQTFSTLNEGLGKVLRYGAHSPEVLTKLRWMEQVLAPALARAVHAMGGVETKAMIAQALLMGDECHNRNKAATSLFLREVAPYLVETGTSTEETASVLRFIHGNDHFFVNLSMATCKAATLASHGIPFSSVVTTLARNGTDFGIRVSGLGNSWYIAPAQPVKGLYFSGFSEEDANPDIGDSAITETAGIGGFAMATAPAIVRFIGGTPADALRYTLEMYDITVAEESQYQLPPLSFRGSPVGIDIRQVVRQQLLPIINTGIAHRLPGIGQVGAGIVRPPMECFVAAVRDLAANIQGGG